MSTMGIAIGATALSLILVVIWLISLSLRKQRLEQERKAREVAYRKAIEKARLQEKKDHRLVLRTIKAIGDDLKTCANSISTLRDGIRKMEMSEVDENLGEVKGETIGVS